MTILRKEDQEFLNKVKSGNNKPVVNTTPKQESLSERIDNKLAEMSQKSPVIGKFFASALGGVKGLVEHPIDTLRGFAGGVVSAPEKLIRTLKTETDLTLTGNKARYDKETGKPIIYIENGVPVIKQQKTLAGRISGDETMGQAVRYDDPDFTRKILSAGVETGLNFLLPELKGLSTAKKISLGTGLGAGYGVTSEAQRDNPDYVAGAGAGAGVGALLSGVGALAKKGKIKPESVVEDFSKPEPKETLPPPPPPKETLPPPPPPKETLPSIDINTGKVTKGKSMEYTDLPSIDTDTGKITKKEVIKNIIGEEKNKVIDGVETKLSRDLRQKYPELEATNYESKTNKEITDSALRIKEKTPQQFEDISLGKKTTGNRALDAKIQEIAINEADRIGDTEKIRELAKNTVRSEAGQNLGLMQVEAGNGWSLLNMINKVKRNYRENIKGIKADNIERIKQDGKKVLQEAKKMKVEELNNFLNDIIC